MKLGVFLLVFQYAMFWLVIAIARVNGWSDAATAGVLLGGVALLGVLTVSATNSAEGKS